MMSSKWQQRFSNVLKARRVDNAFRSRRTIDSPQGSEIQIGNTRHINFSSNDYLGLANHPDVVEAFSSAAARYGVGAGASHLVIGHSSEHQLLEEKIAAFTGRERALLFSSGYMANVGVFNAIVKKGDTLFLDKRNHASLIDGALASDATTIRYRHCDIEHLTKLLQSKKTDMGCIVTDSVFSMDGDIAPLNELAILAQENDCLLYVDDAHGFGVLGDTGAGAAEKFVLSQRHLPILMGTLGKAIGVSGAFVAGSEELIETLIQQSRNYIYTTAMPPACAAAARAAINIAESDVARRTRLQSHIVRFKGGLRAIGLPDNCSETAIQPVIIGSNENTLNVSDALLACGVAAIAIRPPTVLHGTSRIRFSLTADHTTEQIDIALNALEDALKKLGLSDVVRS